MTTSADRITTVRELGVPGFSQSHISAQTPMGATPIDGGVTFRVWAPRAREVYVNGTFGGVACWEQTPDRLMRKDANGHWTAFVAGARVGDPYKYYVVGDGSRGFKRDPYARDLATDVPFPHCDCIVRDPQAYPWHDRGFVPPAFSDMIVYQLHIGSYAPSVPGATATFLDVVERLEHLAALGVNVIQPMPVDEAESSPSLGYNGSDYFSGDLCYVVTDPAVLAQRLATVNRLLAAKGLPPMRAEQIASGYDQLKAMIDLCHVYGIAVVFDVVYNHAGGFFGDDESLYFWDRAVDGGDQNQSLYFTDRGWAGGLSFALWNADVRAFLIDTARYYVEELHVDGFRYDEISALAQLNGASGWSFCQDLTGTLRFLKPSALHNAEFWPVNADVVTPAANGGAGCDVTQHDGLRDRVREAIRQASYGADARVDLDAVAASLWPSSLGEAWRAVTCVENHDLVRQGRAPRVPSLADGADARSWYARSRSRVATALLLTAPGIPMLFMGQEVLEFKQWSDNTNAGGLIAWPDRDGGDPIASDHLRFVRDAVALRRAQPALRGESLRVVHVHGDNRILAFHRWLEGEGRDVLVVVSLSDRTWEGYAIGFPRAGRWLEVMNTDVYDHFPNPWVAGNGGAVEAVAEPLHGFEASCRLTIPANAVLVFAQDTGG